MAKIIQIKITGKTQSMKTVNKILEKLDILKTLLLIWVFREEKNNLKYNWLEFISF